jgi:hypothetical protein
MMAVFVPMFFFLYWFLLRALCIICELRGVWESCLICLPLFFYFTASLYCLGDLWTMLRYVLC